MEIFFLLTLIIFSIFLVLKKVFYSAKRNLFRDQAAWSGKEIKIRHNKSKEIQLSERNDNYLNIIADESELYLEDKSQHDT